MSFREVLTEFGYPVVSKEIAKQVRRYRKHSVQCRNDMESFQKSFAFKAFDGLNFRKDGKPSSFNCKHYKFLLGAPFRISEECCSVMKEWSALLYEESSKKKAFIGIRASESRRREFAWRQHGCNAFSADRPNSKPIAFWTEQDVLQYLHEEGLKLAEAYGEIVVDKQTCRFCTTKCSRTGCTFCLFGIKYDKERITRLQAEEPSIADYVLRGGEFKEDGYWCPSRDGLGFWFVIEWLNRHGMSIPYSNAQVYAEKYGNSLTKQILQ